MPEEDQNKDETGGHKDQTPLLNVATSPYTQSSPFLLYFIDLTFSFPLH